MAKVIDKWGQEVAERGFAQIPNYLLFANQFLDPRLTPIEFLVLLQLAGAWWDKGGYPYPSMATLAVRCGASSRQIQRAITSLEKRGFLKRVTRRDRGIIASNAYDLSPLVSLLLDIAKRYPNGFPRIGVRARARQKNVEKIDVESLGAIDISKIPEKRD